MVFFWKLFYKLRVYFCDHNWYGLNWGSCFSFGGDMHNNSGIGLFATRNGAEYQADFYAGSYYFCDYIVVGNGIERLGYFINGSQYTLNYMHRAGMWQGSYNWRAIADSSYQLLSGS